jgi:hypothetical protein
VDGGKRRVGHFGEVAGLIVAHEDGNAGEFAIHTLRSEQKGLLRLGAGRW